MDHLNFKPTEQEAELWRAYRATRSNEARNAIIVAYLPFVQRLIARLSRKLKVDPDDMLQTGTIGMIDSIERFNTEGGKSFKGFAHQRIRGAILDDARKADWIPRHSRLRFNRVDRIRSTHLAEHGVHPTYDQIVKKLGLDKDEAHRFLNDHNRVASLSIGRFSPETMERVRDARTPSPFDVASRRDMVEWMLKIVAGRDRLFVLMYYLWGWNMDRIGRYFGITGSRVSQMRDRITRHLRERFEKSMGEPTRSRREIPPDSA